MPQMYPLNWMFMFILFITIFTFAVNKIFYMTNINIQSSNMSTNMTLQSSNLWKW